MKRKPKPPRVRSRKRAARNRRARLIRRKPLPPFRRHYRHLRELRRWWHQVLRSEGRYECYAFFLVLPSDEEAIRYLMDFGDELDILSGENCLVIIVGEKTYEGVGSGQAVWGKAIKEYIETGYSSQVGQLFEIDFSQFPCLVIFNDIRSPEHMVISLKSMTTEAIAEEMRHVFSTIQRAVSEKEDPLATFERRQKSEALHEAGKTALGKIRSIAGKTFEAAMEAWIQAVIRQGVAP